MTLLRDLSDEQLVQYVQLADDQMRRENRFDWAQVAVGILATAAIASTLLLSLQSGLDRGRAAIGGLAGLSLYWPYRKAKARRIWREHMDAARAEQARRAGAQESAAAGEAS